MACPHSPGRPTASSIAFTSSGPDAKAKKDRKEKYGDFEIVGGDYTMTHLWLVRVPADLPSDLKQLPKPEALTKGDQFSVAGFSWAPDGKRIAFSASRDPDLGSQDTEQLYVLDLADRHVHKLLDAGGPNGRPKWSPDGRQIAFVTSSGNPFFYYANRRIAVMPAEGGAPRVADRELRRRHESDRLGSRTASTSARRQKTNAHIFRVDPATRAVKRITGPDQFHLGDASFTKDHRTLAGVGAGAEPVQRSAALLRLTISRRMSRPMSPRSGRTSSLPRAR